MQEKWKKNDLLSLCTKHNLTLCDDSLLETWGSQGQKHPNISLWHASEFPSESEMYMLAKLAKVRLIDFLPNMVKGDELLGPQTLIFRKEPSGWDMRRLTTSWTGEPKTLAEIIRNSVGFDLPV